DFLRVRARRAAARHGRGRRRRDAEPARGRRVLGHARRHRLRPAAHAGLLRRDPRVRVPRRRRGADRARRDRAPRRGGAMTVRGPARAYLAHRYALLFYSLLFTLVAGPVLAALDVDRGLVRLLLELNVIVAVFGVTGRPRWGVL